jgi:hypothetical protein
MKPLDLPVENLVYLLDIVLQTDALARFDQVVPPDARMKLRIVQQKIREFRALLNQVQLCVSYFY